MNEAPSARHPHEKLRASLIDAILFRIEQEVEDAISLDISKDVRKTILDEVLPNSRIVLEALSTEDLQNECGLGRHIDSVVTTARYSVNRIAAERGRS